VPQLQFDGREFTARADRFLQLGAAADLRSYAQNRARGVPQDILRHGAQQQLSESRATVSSDHDEVYVIFRDDRAEVGPNFPVAHIGAVRDFPKTIADSFELSRC
jgi:hypothetical protein